MNHGDLIGTNWDLAGNTWDFLHDVYPKMAMCIGKMMKEWV